MEEHEHEFKRLPISALHTHPSRQRPLDRGRAAKLAKSFNPVFAQVPVVAANDDGTYNILDGQHEIWAQSDLGHTEVEVKVIYGLSPEMQASAFLGLNERSAVRAITKFNVAAEAGEEPQYGLQATLSYYGWEASQSSFAAVTTLLKISKVHGVAAAQKVVQTITLAWGNTQREGAHQCIVSALGEIYGKRNPDMERLISALGRVDPKVIRRNAEAGPQSVSKKVNFANEILGHYNKGLRADNRLDLLA